MLDVKFEKILTFKTKKQQNMKKALKIIGITLLSIIGIWLIGVGIVAINSAGKLAQLQRSIYVTRLSFKY